MSSADDSTESLLDAIAPDSLKQFDAFPKLPATYRARSESRGLLTTLVALLAFILVLNDLGEYIWGWPDYEFSVDGEARSTLDVNVDMVVKMPCQYLSVDLRDAVGDRLYLSSAFRRDGTLFDIGQASLLQEHTKQLTASQAVAQSRRSRGLFDVLLQRSGASYKPTYNHQPDGGACRIYGSIKVRKVTANLHITTAGHGYASMQHVDHKLMNLSHVISEFSFGPFFPEITQPLDNSFELTHDPFIAYQYFLHIVPTTYVAPRSAPLKTAQYSVTHYTRKLEHGRGTPGIFFKFDLDPLAITVNQRTTSLPALFIRVMGVVGGLFVCMGYAVKITSHAVEAVTGPDPSQGLVAAEATGAARGLKAKWGGGELRSRVVRQGSGWAVEGTSPYGSPGVPGSPFGHAQSPSFGSPSFVGSATLPPPPSRGNSHAGTPVGSPMPGAGFNLPPGSPMPGAGFNVPAPGSPYAYPSSPGSFHAHSRNTSMSGRPASLYSAPPTPNMYGQFPPTPGLPANGFPGEANGHGANGVNGVNGRDLSRSPAFKDPKKDD